MELESSSGFPVFLLIQLGKLAFVLVPVGLLALVAWYIKQPTKKRGRK